MNSIGPEPSFMTISGPRDSFAPLLLPSITKKNPRLCLFKKHSRSIEANRRTLWDKLDWLPCLPEWGGSQYTKGSCSLWAFHRHYLFILEIRVDITTISITQLISQIAVWVTLIIINESVRTEKWKKNCVLRFYCYHRKSVVICCRRCSLSRPICSLS